MSDIRSAPAEELHSDIEFAQKAKLSYQRKILKLRAKISDLQMGVTGAQCVIDDAFAELQRREHESLV